MQKESIKNIIFDLGVVIINIDTERTTKAMKNLGFSDFDRSYSLFKQTNLFDKLEKGLTKLVTRNLMRRGMPCY